LSQPAIQQARFEYFSNYLPEITYKEHGDISAKCPFHLDNVSSLSISLDKGFFNCHAGSCKQGGLVAFESYMNPGMSKAEAKKNVFHLLPEKAAVSGLIDYIYTDAKGNELFFKRRLTSPDGSKIIRFCHRDFGGNVVYNTRDIDTKVLYNLPDVLAANTVFITEGEKAADRLAEELGTQGYPSALGAIAVTTAGGAGNWQPQFGKFLTGKSVFVFPDNHDAGKVYANAVLRSTVGVAKEVKNVLLSGLPAKGDPYDFLETNSVEELLEEIEKAAAVTEVPAEVTEQRGPDGRIIDFWKREHSCYSILKTFDDLDDTPQNFLIEGILAKGNCSISSDPGTGKTWMGLAIAHSLITGEPFAGHFKVLERAPVYYLTPEVSDGSLRKRLIKVGLDQAERGWFQCQTMDSEPKGMEDESSKEDKGLLEDDDLLEAISRDKPVVILDTLSNFLEGEENSASDMREIKFNINQMRRKGAVAVLMLHHLPKNRTTNGTMATAMRGSGELVGNLDLALTLEKYQKGDCDFTVHNPKNRDGQTVSNFRLRGNFEGDRFKFECPAIEKSIARKGTQVTELAELAAKVAAIKAKHPGMSWENIAAALGLPRQTLQNKLKKHNEQSRIAVNWAQPVVA
jgi:KaiC/GvpD/RAD55 family RecA-like ATPase